MFFENRFVGLFDGFCETNHREDNLFYRLQLPFYLNFNDLTLSVCRTSIKRITKFDFSLNVVNLLKSCLLSSIIWSIIVIILLWKSGWFEEQSYNTSANIQKKRWSCSSFSQSIDGNNCLEHWQVRLIAQINYRYSTEMILITWQFLCF